MSLTKHPSGSIRELWTVSFPLLLSTFSLGLMLFVDRWLLARYSTDALNAAVHASTLGWAFVLSSQVFGGISEVFVAQYNGAGEKEKLGAPVWQMLYLSLFSLFIFLPLFLWGVPLVYGPEQYYERQYLEIMMLFGPCFAAYGALLGFFIGQGKTALITFLAILANIVNAGFDVLLIFGVEGWIPSLGVQGAAIATCGSTLFQALIFFAVFLNSKNRSSCHTADCRFRPALFKRCLRVGSPLSFFVAIEILGWSVFYTFMMKMGPEYITVASISQSLAILFFFLPEGISKGATAVVGNLIGAGKPAAIRDVFRSGLKIHLFFFAAMLLFYALFHEQIIAQFLFDADPSYREQIHQPLLICMGFSLTYVFLEGVRFLLSGILTAAEDTFFLFVSGTLAIWLLMVVPVYCLIVKLHGSVELSVAIWIFYAAAASFIYFLRLRAQHTYLPEEQRLSINIIH